MKSSRLVILPLLVMVLLTFLVGGTAYQQTQSWKNEMGRVVNDVSRAVILSNIRWGLRKIQRERAEYPETAQKDWLAIQKQLVVLNKLSGSSHRASVDLSSTYLQGVLKTENPSPLLINALLQSDFFSFDLDQVDALKRLQTQAQTVTQTVTLSMIALGLVLAALTVYDLERLFQQLARSRDVSIQVQEEERRRIAQDLHDGVVQELIGLKRQFAPDKVDEVINNLRRVCHNLKPQVLEDLGLPAALEFLADDLRQSDIANVQVTLDEPGLSQLPKSLELPLFRVVQEMCSNVKHHARASQVKLTLAYNPQESPMLSGSVSDNGVGFDACEITPDHMGLAGIRERIRQMGGQLSIQSQPGHGSRFQFVIPVKQNA